MSNNAHELSNRLLNALDNNYNVVDMHTVNEIISVLERINITKELLETTRLGKHVNELRRKTTDPTLARRAKVLVKRWRDLVIPTVASPGHTGSNRSSAERQVRGRLGGTPLTSPALSRQVVSPAVPSPRPPSRPAWGGYESDSQDVILVDDEPAAPAHPLPPPPPLAPSILAHTHKPLTPPVKRQISPEPLFDEKKAKRDKKPKKKRGHSRAGSGTEATGPAAAGAGVPPASPAAVPPACPAPVPAACPAPVPPACPAPWGTRNGTHERRRNGTKRDTLDSYAALVNRMPPAGAKKVKTTKELLEQIQSRGSKPATSPPGSPRSPASPDVMLIEPDTFVKADSPLRNGGSSPRPPSPAASPPAPPSPLEEPREEAECTCGEEEQEECPARARGAARVAPRLVHALHHALLGGVNGTRAPPAPHRFAVRPAARPDRPDLFASVVPLYKYSDYADDYCAKNMSRVPLCPHLPWTEFAPPPPDLPPPPEPPPLRPYPLDPEPAEPARTADTDGDDDDDEDAKPDVKPVVKLEPDVKKEIEVEPEMVGAPPLEPSERLKAPLLTPEEETQFERTRRSSPDVEQLFASSSPQHRSVPRTKAEEPGGGAALVAACRAASAALPYAYSWLACAPVLPRTALASDSEVRDALAAADPARDELGRPARPARFAEWHECACLGDLVALPYVVLD